MNSFFLKQLKYNNNIFLKNVSENYNISLNSLIKKYKFSKSDTKIGNKKEIIKIYENLYIDSDNKYYIVFKDVDLNFFNAIVINL